MQRATCIPSRKSCLQTSVAALFTCIKSSIFACEKKFADKLAKTASRDRIRHESSESVKSDSLLHGIERATLAPDRARA
jgi:hypothetical protein